MNDPDSMELILRDLEEDPFLEGDSGTGSQTVSSSERDPDEAGAAAAAEAAAAVVAEDLLDLLRSSCKGQQGFRHPSGLEDFNLLLQRKPRDSIVLMGVHLTPVDAGDHGLDLFLRNLLKFERQAAKSLSSGYPGLVELHAYLTLLLSLSKLIGSGPHDESSLPMAVKILDCLQIIKCYLGTSSVQNLGQSSKSFR